MRHVRPKPKCRPTCFRPTWAKPIHAQLQATTAPRSSAASGRWSVLSARLKAVDESSSGASLMSIRTCTNTFQLPFGRAGPDPWALPAARSPDARALRALSAARLFGSILRIAAARHCSRPPAQRSLGEVPAAHPPAAGLTPWGEGYWPWASSLERATLRAECLASGAAGAEIHQGEGVSRGETPGGAAPWTCTCR